MTPGIHPPCTPSASCQPMRCHPTPPPCQNPSKCLSKTIKKGIKPCKSAVSILATQSKKTCGSCGKFNKQNVKDPRKTATIKKFLKRKSQEGKLKKEDRLTGSHKLLAYTRKQGSAKPDKDCCAGHGHRGRLKKGAGGCKCNIL